MAKRGSSKRGSGAARSRKPRRERGRTRAEVYRLIPGYDPFETAGDCTFDNRAAKRAIDFFHECLTFTAGEWMGQPFVLEDWQEAIVGNIFGWKRPDGRRRYREVFVFVPRKCGKALAVDTPIPTPCGWKLMGDLREGDTVFDENGLPTRVTHAFDVMHDRPCYRVTFSDGTSIVADADHQWPVREGTEDWLVVGTTELVVGAEIGSAEVTDVKATDSVPVRCIAVDSPSHLYLAGEGMIATHNSELAGGLGNLLTFADGEPGAQVYCAAADREQARLVFNAAKTMVAAEPELASRSRTYTNSIVVAETSSVLKVVSAEAYSKHGINAHGIIIDELHAQPNRDLVDVLTTSTGARRQPLIIHITTADYDRESICNEKYDYACKVRDGVIEDPAFLPVIYEATLEDDWTAPDVWTKANPNLGVSVSTEYLERECRRARETPTYENTFKRLHLNMRTQQDVRWLALEQWDACSGDPTCAAGPTGAAGPIDEEALLGEACFVGLDLSTTTDVSALVMVFRDEDGVVTVVPRFWIPGDNAKKREDRDRVPYVTWARLGLIEMTPGNVVDYEVIRSGSTSWSSSTTSARSPSTRGTRRTSPRSSRTTGSRW